jgi:hypothetical protein
MKTDRQLFCFPPNPTTPLPAFHTYIKDCPEQPRLLPFLSAVDFLLVKFRPSLLVPGPNKIGTHFRNLL